MKTFSLFLLLFPFVASGKPVALMSTKEVLALTLYMEARGEGKEGLQAVADVIANRAKAKGFRKVCLAPKQFSCWNGKIFVTIPKDKMYVYCKDLAEKTLKSKPRYKFTHYFNPSLCSPKWAVALKEKKQIGNHIFGTI